MEFKNITGVDEDRYMRRCISIERGQFSALTTFSSLWMDVQWKTFKAISLPFTIIAKVNVLSKYRLCGHQITKY